MSPVSTVDDYLAEVPEEMLWRGSHYLSVVARLRDGSALTRTGPESGAPEA